MAVSFSPTQPVVCGPRLSFPGSIEHRIHASMINRTIAATENARPESAMPLCTRTKHHSHHDARYTNQRNRQLNPGHVELLDSTCKLQRCINTPPKAPHTTKPLILPLPTLIDTTSTFFTKGQKQLISPNSTSCWEHSGPHCM